LQRAVEAGGRFVRYGAFPFIVVIMPETPITFRESRATGALLVADPRASPPPAIRPGRQVMTNTLEAFQGKVALALTALAVIHVPILVVVCLVLDHDPLANGCGIRRSRPCRSRSSGRGAR